MPKLGRAVAIVTALMLLVAAVITVVLHSEDRDNQKQRFGQDIAVMQFIPAPEGVYWERDQITYRSSAGRKVTTTESVMEAQVLVRDCKVQLFQRDGEGDLFTKPEGRGLRVYHFGEVNLVNPAKEEDIKDWDPKVVPTPTSIDEYLKRDTKRFRCYNPKAKLSLVA